ncbi:MAG: biopolymer transporter ExbD [Prosthecobacter sp.]|nr:biopolymer transporter ExbD [Prosthecobacter sp.]
MKLESYLPKQSPWLYITPLLNAILLLLVYFLFSSGFIVQSGIRVEKPRSTSRLTGFDRAHIITLAAGNEAPIYFDGQRIALEELRGKIEAQGRDGERRIILHADRHTLAGRLIEVSNVALDLGFEVAYSTTPNQAAPSP